MKYYVSDGEEKLGVTGETVSREKGEDKRTEKVWEGGLSSKYCEKREEKRNIGEKKIYIREEKRKI